MNRYTFAAVEKILREILEADIDPIEKRRMMNAILRLYEVLLSEWETLVNAYCKKRPAAHRHDPGGEEIVADLLRSPEMTLLRALGASMVAAMMGILYPGAFGGGLPGPILLVRMP